MIGGSARLLYQQAAHVAVFYGTLLLQGVSEMFANEYQRLLEIALIQLVFLA